MTAVINDEEVVPCSSKEAQQLLWSRHFSKVLNLRSQFEEEVLESVRQRDVNGSIAGKPTERAVMRTLGKLKNGKAAGYSNILPEMFKGGTRNDDFVSMLTKLMSAVWEYRCVPHEWADAILVLQERELVLL